MYRIASSTLSLLAGLACVAPAAAGEGSWFSGDWHLTVGATGLTAPSFEGSSSYRLRATPIISLGKAGPEARFTSRNDSISLGFIDDGGVRAGLTGKLIFGRDSDDDAALAGLSDVPFGGEAGAFLEFYPTDFIRVRVEARHGIRSHDGIVGDIAVDAFHDITPDVRISGGPRLSAATAGYFDAFYGVDFAESLASGIDVYDPGGGLKSVGVGGAVSWRATDQITTSVFGEYSRLLGPAADSTLVRSRGSADQFIIGVSASYRFDFHL